MLAWLIPNFLCLQAHNRSWNKCGTELLHPFLTTHLSPRPKFKSTQRRGAGSSRPCPLSLVERFRCEWTIRRSSFTGFGVGSTNPCIESFGVAVMARVRARIQLGPGPALKSLVCFPVKSEFQLKAVLDCFLMRRCHSCLDPNTFGSVRCGYKRTTTFHGKLRHTTCENQGVLGPRARSRLSDCNPTPLRPQQLDQFVILWSERLNLECKSVDNNLRF